MEYQATDTAWVCAPDWTGGPCNPEGTGSGRWAALAAPGGGWNVVRIRSASRWAAASWGSLAEDDPAATADPAVDGAEPEEDACAPITAPATPTAAASARPIHPRVFREAERGDQLDQRRIAPP